jgi:hypothetical protein
MIYGHRSKAIDIRELLGHHGDRDFGGDENTDSEAGDGDGGDDGDNNAFLMLLTSYASIPALKMKMLILWLKMTIDTQVLAIAASILTHITTISLARFRRDGPFGKLHSIDVLLRKNSQLKQAFIAAQIAVNPGQQPLAWVHNMATRWSSDYIMAAKAL